MKQVAELSAEQRGNKNGAKFHDTVLFHGGFPPLAPLVRALAALRIGPGLSGR